MPDKLKACLGACRRGTVTLLRKAWRVKMSKTKTMSHHHHHSVSLLINKKKSALVGFNSSPICTGLCVREREREGESECVREKDRKRERQLDRQRDSQTMRES
jgi:hypothetical protein